MQESEIVEKVARALAVADGWTQWDTAVTVSDTLSGNEPSDEREHYLDSAKAAISTLASLGFGDTAAARREGREEAAKVADAEAPDWEKVTGNPCTRIVAAIRALETT